MYVVVRNDLNPGYQVAQLCHAAIGFQYQFPEIAKNWYENSNFIACLSIKNLSELEKFCSKLDASNLRYAKFYEPDLDNELTAIAIEPGIKTKKICSSLPLALKHYSF